MVIRFLVLTVAGLALAATPMGAGTANDKADSDKSPCFGSDSTGVTVSQKIVGDFGYFYYLYEEAIANEDSAGVAENERQLTQLITCDLAASDKRVRELARKVTTAGGTLPSSAESAEGLATGSLSGARMMFCLSLETLNAKEAVLRDIRKAYDLKHKYRLLGDYLNLLRRELNMPSLRLATSGAAPSDTPSGYAK